MAQKLPFSAGLSNVVGWRTVAASDDGLGYTAVCLRVDASGTLSFRDASEPGATKAMDVAAGQIIPGQFTHVMAATTATVHAGVNE